ncbi:hypothetical protein [Novosphingobium sp. 9]|uniref:hypothetical protein n=1 Tax=Novosphingobium sp. 9 TaxID=2025349 RepID=UPI0021B6C904|nr:hypothetical protein [Novosphingobium sp. 9]
MSRWTTVCVLMACFLSAAALPASAGTGWNSYANARFGYSICYPAGLLEPAPESDNGDGRTFTGAQGAKLAVWGNWNVLSSSAKEARAVDLARLRQSGYEVTYNVMKPGWYVLSGTGTHGIVYLKSLIGKEKQVTFELRYPAAEAAHWNPVSAHLSQCLAG